MAATRLSARHQLNNKTVEQCLRARISYAANPDKTQEGTYISAHGCDPKTAVEEFLLSWRQYALQVGQRKGSTVIAYQIRQSFAPGEITPEEANRVGYETAIRWTKGKYAFVVATHTDRRHIHNHIIYNAVDLDGYHKFKNFSYSALALQRLSDTICLEHGLSVIEKQPQRQRNAPQYDPNTLRNGVRRAIDQALQQDPDSMEAFLKLLREMGYEVKVGAYIALKDPNQQRFIRLRSLGEGYTEDAIRAVLAGTAVHRSKFQRTSFRDTTELSLILDLQKKLREKGAAYERWAAVFNLKQMANVLLLLSENNIDSAAELQARTDEVHAACDRFQLELRNCEAQIKEVQALKHHIIDYAQTRDTYVAYRKAGYSKKFLTEHWDEIQRHREARRAFQGMKKIPKVKELNVQLEALYVQRSRLRQELREERKHARELELARANIRLFYAQEKHDAAQKQERQRPDSAPCR